MDMVRFITSREMNTAFDMDALITFAITCHSVHDCGHNKILADWFVPKLHKWSQNSHYPLFTFNSDGFDNKKRGFTTHNIISNALPDKRGCNKSVSDAKKRAFGANLTVKAWSATKNKKK